VDVHFDVIGEDKASRLQELSAGLATGDWVRFHGYVPYAEALKIVATADVGVVPHHVTEHWSTTIPNKLFDYMAAGIPVLVSSAPPAQRIVEETGCGLPFRDRDARHLADQIQRLLPAWIRREMGRAGVQAVSERYNWTHDGARLVHRIESVAEQWYGTAEGRGLSRVAAA
jgi:glycosyltransferase involved in cell wall biosynthesis